MYLIHYYLQKGFDPDKIAALPHLSKTFYAASMKLSIEETAEQYKAMLGGGA